MPGQEAVPSGIMSISRAISSTELRVWSFPPGKGVGGEHLAKEFFIEMHAMTTTS